MIFQQTGQPVPLIDGLLRLTNGPAKWDFVVGWANQTPVTFTTDQYPGLRLRGKGVLVTCTMIVKLASHESGDKNSFNIRGCFADDSMITFGDHPLPGMYLKGYYSTKRHEGCLSVVPTVRQYRDESIADEYKQCSFRVRNLASAGWAASDNCNRSANSAVIDPATGNQYYRCSEHRGQVRQDEQGEVIDHLFSLVADPAALVVC